MGSTPVVDAKSLMGSELVRLLKPLEAMMRWFDAAGVRAAIIGGVAASLLGKPRLTKDIDAVVLDVEAEVLIQSGAHYGFQPRIADAVDFARNTRMLLLRFTEGEIDIDLSLGALPFEYEVIDRSSMIDVGGGVSIRVASPEDIVVMKAIAGRGRDVMDIENIIQANPALDVERIRRWVREFSTVLEMPEIHDALEKLLRQRPR
jgi:predicted nucleotidyltransferase